MITEFQIQNYKALRDIKLELTPIHVLIGPNDSGKTSILESITALCRSVDHNLGDAFVGSWDGRSLVSNLADEPNIQLAARLSSGTSVLTYVLGCTFPPTGRQVIQEREHVAQDGTLAADLGLPDSPFTYVFHRCHLGKKSHVDNRLDEAELERRGAFAQSVFEALSGVQFYRFNPSMLSLPVAADSNRKFRMEPNGFGLALCLDNILGHDRERFTDLEAAFRDVFPQVKSVKLTPQMGFKSVIDDPQLNPQLTKGDGKGLHFSFANGKGDVRAEQMSDGALLVLAYLAVLYSPEPPSVLLIEEPENGIHPHRLGDVLGILRRLVDAQQKTQIIMTTHSPYVVDLFKPSEVTLCQQTEPGIVVVKRLEESPKVREQLDVFTLGEIWTSEGDEAIAN